MHFPFCLLPVLPCPQAALPSASTLTWAPISPFGDSLLLFLGLSGLNVSSETVRVAFMDISF